MALAKGDTLSSLSGDILARPEHYLDDFRTQLREMPMLADMAGRMVYSICVACVV